MKLLHCVYIHNYDKCSDRLRNKSHVKRHAYECMTSRDGHCNKFTFPHAAKMKRTTASILRVTMPPKSKKRRQSLEAAARGREVLNQDAMGREVLKQARLGQDSSEITVSPNDAQGIPSGNLTEPAQRDIPQSREETGPSVSRGYDRCKSVRGAGRAC